MKSLLKRRTLTSVIFGFLTINVFPNGNVEKNFSDQSIELIWCKEHEKLDLCIYKITDLPDSINNGDINNTGGNESK